MFKHLKVGDIALRNFCDIIQQWPVTSIDEYNGWITIGMGWMFDPETGVEEDPTLGWGREFGTTGSFLVLTLKDVEDDLPMQMRKNKNNSAL